MSEKSRWRGRMAVGVAVAVVSLATVAWGENGDSDRPRGENEQGTALHEFMVFAGFEAHLARLEERLENYQQGKEKADAERDASWSNRLQLLDADITERYMADLQNEANAIRKSCQTNLAAALGENQENYNRYSAALRQYEEGWRKKAIVWGFATFGIIVGVSLLGLCLVALTRKGVGNNLLYCFEMVLSVAVLALIVLGTYDLVARILDWGIKGGGSHEIVSPDGNRAVLQAYEQLSNELGRWGTLMGIMGTFFGLVLPVGGYLLQLKVVRREEEKTEKSIQDKTNGFTEQVKNMIGESTHKVDAKVENQVAEIWNEFLEVQYIEFQKCSLALDAHGSEDRSVTVESMSLWAQLMSALVSVLRTLPHIRGDEVIRAKLILLRDALREIVDRDDCSSMRETFEKIRKKQPYASEKWLEKLRERCPVEMTDLRALLAKCGIVFAENEQP